MTQYYIAINNQPTGPYTIDQLRQMNITPASLVWANGMPEWITAGEVDELRTQLFGMPPRTTSQNQDPSYNPDGFNKQPFQQNPYQPNPGNPYNPQPNNPFQNPGNQNMPPCPPSYLVWSIISIFLCCIVTGIIATIYSSRVESRYRMGDYQGALDASNTARTLNIISIVLGIISGIVNALYFSAVYSTMLNMI